MPSSQLFLPLGVKRVLDQLGRTCGFKRERSVPPPISVEPTHLWKHGIEVKVVRRARARRYLLRLQADGTARLVIPRRGSRREALLFLERNEAWLLERFRHWQTHRSARQPWLDGTTFPFRGEATVLRVEKHGDEAELRFADQVLRTPAADDYREAILGYLRRIAERELPVRAQELAQAHGISIKRVTIRAQKTRWGSCSARGTISLNWRVIQAPAFVQVYLIIHELMHCREMNHSARYWKLVATAFPDYRAAEQWLKRTRLAEMD